MLGGKWAQPDGRAEGGGEAVLTALLHVATSLVPPGGRGAGLPAGPS